MEEILFDLPQNKMNGGVNTYTSIVDMVTEEKLDIDLIANENFNHAFERPDFGMKVNC